MKKEYRVLGLMSGTSCDGLDIASCFFNQKDGKWNYSIENAATYPYPNDLEETLKNVIALSALELAVLDIKLGDFFAEKINNFKREYDVKNIDFIASHGHTVFHQPNEKLTLQIGNGQAIYENTQIPAINNFRISDVLKGGQGAPLVPAGDKILLSAYHFCLNLGGISNISFDKDNQRIAFDIGPHNLAINIIAQKKGLNMDKNGEIAKKGTLQKELKNTLDDFEYYKKSAPKSLGIEDLHHTFFPLLNKSSYNIEDTMHTLYHHLAKQISKVINTNATEKAMVLVTGGGAHNLFFIELLQQYVGADTKIIVPDKKLIDFKEALVFAFLGVLRSRKEINIYKSVTGACQNSIAGVLHGF